METGLSLPPYNRICINCHYSLTPILFTIKHKVYNMSKDSNHPNKKVDCIASIICHSSLTRKITNMNFLKWCPIEKQVFELNLIKSNRVILSILINPAVQIMCVVRSRRSRKDRLTRHTHKSNGAKICLGKEGEKKNQVLNRNIMKCIKIPDVQSTRKSHSSDLQQ